MDENSLRQPICIDASLASMMFPDCSTYFDGLAGFDSFAGFDDVTQLPNHLENSI
jgi:hypothetical protein